MKKPVQMVGAPERVEPDCSGMFVEAAYAMAKIYQPARAVQHKIQKISNHPGTTLECLRALYKQEMAQISQKQQQNRNPPTLIHLTTTITIYLVFSLLFTQTFRVFDPTTEPVICKCAVFARQTTKGFCARLFLLCCQLFFLRNFCLGLPPVSSMTASTASS
jgi:hypothetical protein